MISIKNDRSGDFMTFCFIKKPGDKRRPGSPVRMPDRQSAAPDIYFRIRGGALAVGHPYGASGAALVTRLFYEAKRRPDARYAAPEAPYGCPTARAPPRTFILEYGTRSCCEKTHIGTCHRMILIYTKSTRRLPSKYAFFHSSFECRILK
jgi:hypothetical protein